MSIKYTERLAEACIEPSTGSKGDGYDNVLAETINGLCAVELITAALRGKRVRPSNWSRWNERPSSTIIVCWNRSAIYRRPKPRQTITSNCAVKPPQPDFHKSACTKVGAFKELGFPL
jgi:transposase InsO family protein